MQAMKPPLGSQIIQRDPGLVGCWLMNEGAGNVVHDLSGNGNDGAITGSAWAVSNRGTALNFDGSDYIELPAAADSSGQSERTLSIWFARDSLVTTVALYSECVGVYWRNTIYIRGGAGYSWDTRDTSTGDTGGRDNDLDVTAPNVIGTWYNLVCVYSVSAGTKTMYLDGVLLGSTATGVNPFTATASDFFRIGDDVGGGWSDYLGKVSQVAIYNRALTPSEIASLYRDPYQMFRRNKIELWSAATQGGGVTPPATGYMTLNTGYWGT